MKEIRGNGEREGAWVTNMVVLHHKFIADQVNRIIESFYGENRVRTRHGGGFYYTSRSPGFYSWESFSYYQIKPCHSQYLNLTIMIFPATHKRVRQINPQILVRRIIHDVKSQSRYDSTQTKTYLRYSRTNMHIVLITCFNSSNIPLLRSNHGSSSATRNVTWPGMFFAWK